MTLKTLIILILTFVICSIGVSAWAVSDDDAIMDVDDLYVTASTGTWTQSSWAPCAVGGSYKYAWGSDDSITFQTHQQADIDGLYAVYARYTSHANRANNARYRIYDGSTLTSTQYRNQEQNGCNWVYLATVALTSGNYGRVILDNTGEDSTEATIADAVRFVRLSKDKDDVVDEAGIAYNEINSAVNISATSSTAPTTVVSQTITCPRSGHVAAIATGEANPRTAGDSASAFIIMSLSQSSSWDDSHRSAIGQTYRHGGNHTSSLAMSRTDSCSAGESTTYYLLAYRNGGLSDSNIYQPVIQLMYYPSAY